MRPIFNRNGLVRALITLTFGAEYVKAKYCKEKDILPILPVK